MTTDTVGGVWTFSVELVRELSARGVNVTLAALGGHPTAAQTADLDGLPAVEVVASDHRLEWMEAPWDDVEASCRWLLEIERRVSPDVVHLNTFAHGGLPWRTPVLLSAHSCVLSWWEAVRHEAAPDTWRRYAGCVEKSLRTANLLVTPTHALLDALRKHYAPPSAACVIPNGRDPARFHAARKEPFILAAGRLWDEAKNIAAVARLAESAPWPVHAAGEERSPDGALFDAGSLHLLGRLLPVELADWMSRAAIFVSPARYEPFGLSILEAGLSGCALVLGDIPSLREVWEDDNALFVPPDDAVALEATVQRLIDDPELRGEMGRRARSRAEEFSSRTMADYYFEMYALLIAPDLPPPREQPRRSEPQ